MTVIRRFEKEFANKSNPGKLEEEYFKPLINKGLYEHAIQEYSDFAIINTFSPSHITRSAYLMHYMAYAENEQVSHGDIVSEMNNTSLRAPVSLLSYGSEYLGIDEPISDDLIAASIAATAINNDSDNKKYICLIRNNALDIANHSNALLKDNSHFKEDSTTPEVRALHISQIYYTMRKTVVDAYQEINKNQAYSEKSDFDMQKLIDIVDNIDPDPENSELEALVHDRYKTINDLLDGVAVNTNNIITPLHP